LSNDWSEAKWLQILAKIISQLTAQEVTLTDTFQTLPAEEQLNVLNEQLKRVHWIPQEADSTLLRGLLAVYKANCRATYEIPSQIYSIPLTLFRSQQGMMPDESEELKDNQAINDLLQEPTWGWQQLVTTPITIETVPGDHLTMMTNPHVKVLAERLRHCLDNALVS
jgi:thioesterase domain-containing protein